MFKDKTYEDIKNGQICDLTVFHGSKGGIDGSISPTSRVRCDFGKGFYMGTNIMQAKSLVSNDDMPYYYKMHFRLSEIPKDKILLLDEKKWLYTVLACRHADPEFDELDVAKRILLDLSKYDVVVGPIADDKMREAVSAFLDNGLTDEGLYHCLTYVDYGVQIVAKTETACSKIEILEEKRLKGQELQTAIQFSEEKRIECRTIVEESKKEFNERGRNFYSLIKHEKSRETKDRGDQTI